MQFPRQIIRADRKTEIVNEPSMGQSVCCVYHHCGLDLRPLDLAGQLRRHQRDRLATDALNPVALPV